MPSDMTDSAAVEALAKGLSVCSLENCYRAAATLRALLAENARMREAGEVLADEFDGEHGGAAYQYRCRICRALAALSPPAQPDGHPPVMAALEAVHGEAERLGAHTMQNGASDDQPA